MKPNYFYLFLFLYLFLCSCTTPKGGNNAAQSEVSLPTSKQNPVITPNIPHPSYSIVTELFPGIRGLAFDKKSTLYIADTKGTFHPNRKVYTLKKPYDGELHALPMHFSEPTGLAFRKNHLYVADHVKSEVFQFSPRLKIIRRWKADSPIALLDTPKGLLSLSGGGAVELLRSNGKVDQIFSGLVNPTAFAYAEDGNLWIAEAGSTFVKPRVTKRNFQGHIIKTIDHDWKKPSGLTIDKYSQLWIADPQSNGVFVSLDARIHKGDSVFNTPSFFYQFSPQELLLLEDGNRPRLIKINIE